MALPCPGWYQRQRVARTSFDPRHAAALAWCLALGAVRPVLASLPAGGWTDPQLLLAANHMRSAALPPPGANWVMYYALHGANIACARFLAAAGPEKGCGPPEQLEAVRLLRDGVAAGGVDWVAWEAAGSSFYPLTALLSQYMLSRDDRYPAVFAAIAVDYATNHKRQVLAARGRAGLSLDDTFWGDKSRDGKYKPYAVNAGWELRQGGDVLPQLLLVLAGFLKVQDAPAYTPKDLHAAWKSAAFMTTPLPPATAVTIMSPADYEALRRGLLLDHTSYLAQLYRYAGAVPNQRVSGLAALAMLGNLLGGDCCGGDGGGAVSYRLTLTRSLRAPSLAVPGEAVSEGTLAAVAEFAYGQAREGLREFASNAFYPDGGGLERSINYNAAAVRTMTGAAGLLPPADAAAVRGAVERYSEWEAGMLMPNGMLPPVGNLGREGGELLDPSSAPTTTSFVARYSGYAALRGVGGPGPDSGPGGVAPQQYVAMNFGLRSRGHQLSAAHNIVMAAGAAPLLLSTGGSPTYGNAIDGPAAMFLDEGSSFKCVAWLVDNLNLKATYTFPPYGWAEVNATSSHMLGTRFYEDDTFAVVDNSLWARFGGKYGANQTRTDASATVRHQRMVIAVKPAGGWVVADRVVPGRGDPQGPQAGGLREFRHPWLLAPSVGTGDVQLTPHGFWTSLANGTNVRVRHDRPARLELYYGGDVQSTPVSTAGATASPVRSDIGPLGWSSKSIGDVEPAPNVHSVMAVQGTLSVLTTLQAVPAGAQFPSAPECSRSEEGVTCTHGGRQLRMRWAPDPSYDGIYEGGQRVVPITADSPTLEAPDE